MKFAFALQKGQAFLGLLNLGNLAKFLRSYRLRVRVCWQEFHFGRHASSG